MTNTTENDVLSALADYKANKKTTKQIAKEKGVSKSTVSVWARKARISKRAKGRRPYDQPSVEHRKILELVETLPMKEVGRRLGGMTKQNVHRVCKRWAGWVPTKKPPFKSGDLIKWSNEYFIVVEAGLTSGVVRNAGGQLIRNFHWRMTGKNRKECFAEKVEGTRPKAA